MGRVPVEDLDSQGPVVGGLLVICDALENYGLAFGFTHTAYIYIYICITV